MNPPTLEQVTLRHSRSGSPSGMTPLHVVVLAAGQGKRMRSDLPKVLHLLAGRPLLSHVIDAAGGLGAARVHVVYGHGGGTVREAMTAADVEWVEQRERLGTGHAVAQAMPGIPDDATVLVLYGDVPLVNPATLHETATLAGGSGIALITAAVDEPGGYGRIVRDTDGHVHGIVEEGDASDEQRAIAEINTGILAARAGKLRGWLRRLSRDNAQGEYYLTGVVARAVEGGDAGPHRAAGGDRGGARGQRPGAARGAGTVPSAASRRNPHARRCEPCRPRQDRRPGPRAHRAGTSSST